MELINASGTIGVLPQGMLGFVAIWQTLLLPSGVFLTTPGFHHQEKLLADDEDDEGDL
jgi:hypothetical protein